jgi:HD-GYP domain-containing protein (c-di-GMP phosphodiesterase class II)
MRLFKTILLLMLVASLVPTGMVGWQSVSDTRELLVRDAQELAQERVKQLKLKVEGYLAEPTRAALGLTRVPRFFTLPLEQQRAHVTAVLNQSREVLILTVFDAQGQRAPGLQAIAVSDVQATAVAEHEAQALGLLRGCREVCYGPVRLSARSGRATMTLAFPVGEPVLGYVAVDVSLAGLQSMLAQERVGSSGFVYLTDGQGQLIAGGSGLGSQRDMSKRPVVERLLQGQANDANPELLQVGNFKSEGDESDEVVAAYTVLPTTRWAIVSEQPVALAYKQVETMERRLLLAMLAASVVALLLAAFFSRSITQPLKNFMSGAAELARSKFGVQVDVRSKNELGELAQSFNFMSRQLQKYDEETRRLYDSLEHGYLETIVALANSIDSKDSYTRGHSQRVSDLSVEIGREMGLSEQELKQLRYGGILHDIGKIGIVESILCKQSRLTDEEMAVMREHPAIGDQIIKPVSFLEPVRTCVRHHHERWDGTGYPDKLKGEDIPLVARIVACADTFDACTSTRPYQKAMPLEKAVEILQNLSGKQLDPAVVEAMRRVLEHKGVRLEGHRQPVRLAS